MLSVLSVLAGLLALVVLFAVNSEPDLVATAPIANAAAAKSQMAPTDGTAGEESRGALPIERVDILDGALVLSVAVVATAFDSACNTDLAATLVETATTVSVRVTASSSAAANCPVELRRVTATLNDFISRRTIVDETSGRTILTGGPWPDPTGEHPGDVSIPFSHIAVSEEQLSLALDFNGAAEETGPCGVTYTASVRESPSRVEVRVVGRSAREMPVGIEKVTTMCPDLGGLRRVNARLSEPLGGRSLYDAAGRLLTPG